MGVETYYRWIDHPTGRVLHGTRVVLSGGWPLADDAYPTDFAGALARLVGSGAARTAGFTTDE